MLQEKLQSYSLHTRRVYIEGGTYKPYKNHTVVNWGSSKVPDWYDERVGQRVVNSFDKVAAASNKLMAFNAFKECNVSIPEYTSSRDVAIDWINSGSIVVCRTKLSAHSGAGIVVAARTDDVVQCPLYVKYVKKLKEFRVHVAFGEVIDVQQKKQRAEYDGEIDFAIRNHHTGWIYARNEVEEPIDLREMAVNAVRAVGLDFGAVDLIWNKHANKSYVLEVNTAPGLVGQTVEAYASVFKGNLT